MERTEFLDTPILTADLIFFVAPVLNADNIVC